MAGEDFVVVLLFFLERDSRPSSCEAKELAAEWHDYPVYQEVISY